MDFYRFHSYGIHILQKQNIYIPFYSRIHQIFCNKNRNAHTHILYPHPDIQSTMKDLKCIFIGITITITARNDSIGVHFPTCRSRRLLMTWNLHWHYPVTLVLCRSYGYQIGQFEYLHLWVLGVMKNAIAYYFICIKLDICVVCSYLRNGVLSSERSLCLAERKEKGKALWTASILSPPFPLPKGREGSKPYGVWRRWRVCRR